MTNRKKTVKARTTKDELAGMLTEPEKELTVEEVWNVIEFARASVSSMFPSVITPDLISASMMNKNYNPSVGSEDDISAALADPKNHERQLREFVESMELVSAPFKRILAYMGSMLSFDYTFTSSATEEKDFKSSTYKADEKIFFDFMDRFDYKEQFGKVVKQLLRNEVCIVAPRFDNGEKYVLQELPLNFCKITAAWSWGFLISMRMDYFLQPGNDLRLFPPFFTQEFNKIYGSNNKYIAYNPSLPVEDRGNSTFAQWVDVPPDFGWTFKFDQSISTQVPYYASLMPEFVNTPLIRSLQKNMYMSAANKMLLGSVPLIKDSKSKVSDAIMISPDVLGKFLQLVKSAVGSSVKVAAAPLESMTSVSFESDNDLYSSYLKNGVDSSGVNAPLIFSSKLKANAIESQLSFQSDSLIMEKLYPQFAGFINYFVNKQTKKYKFNVEFQGNAYFLDRQARFDRAMGLANVGIVLPNQIAASLGIKPHHLIQEIKYGKAMGFTDLLTPLMLNSQMPSEGGRPQKSASKLGESGSNTRDNGGNIEKGGSV